MAYIQDWGMRVQAQPQINTTRRAFLHLSQNENGRMLNIRITDVNIPSGSTAVLAGTKPDGTVYSQAGTLSGNTATFAEDVQMTAVAGTWDAKITVTNGGNCICTARITITIDPDTVAGGAVPSDSRLDGIIAECRAIADSVRKEAYGSPLVADAVEDMTDQSRVYVYTGSESGMTAGHWYYYNGSAWADGGVYNAVAVDTDTTLTIAGKAADAKEVGDQLTSVKEDLENNVSNVAAILNDAVLDVTWVNKSINPNTAELDTASSATYASTLYKIPVPKGAKLRIKTGYNVRIVKYKNGGFTFADSTNRWVDVSSSEADYVRYQVATSVANATSYVEISVVMDIGNVAHTDNVAEGINEYNATGKITKTGNPITMQDTAEASLDSISLSNVDSGEELIVCNKNLFKMYPTNVVISKNNTRFELDRENGIIRAIASTGTTEDQPSASENTFPSDYLTLNGKNWVHNYHFRFNVDTVVTITDNCSVYQPYDYLCKLQVSDGTILWNVSDAGVTIVAKAGVMYGVRVMARTGWQGDITFKPQIEISKNATSYEAHNGFKLSAVTSDGSANVFDLVNYSKIAQSHDSGKLKITFNPIDDTLDVIADGISSNLKVYSNEYADGVNGVAYNYIWKGVIGALPVFMRCIPKELVGVATAEISDGTTTWTDSGDGVWLDAVANTEYAMRINLNAGAAFSYTFKPIIATGIEAYKLGGSQCPITNIYTNGDCSITVTAKRITAKEQSERANEMTDHIISVTGGRFLGTYTRKLSRRPMVVFIDDDTSSVSLVTRYHDIFTAKSVVGNYSVITKNLDDNTGLPELLLDYEEQGFGCLYHCYYQSGSATNYFLESERDMEQVRENFYRGLRSIRQYGFQNYKHWVTPYGVNDKDIRNLAKEAGMESLIKMSLTMTSGEILTPYGQLDRWNVPRITISNASSVARYESLVDACVQNNGWLLCVTHVNTWDNTTTMDTKLSDAIQYALTAGASVVSYPEAFEDYRALFYLNELF